MNKYKIYTLIFLALVVIGCEKDFLDTPPQDQFTDETYWTSEGNVKTFAYGFYPAYFVGYGSGYTWGDYFSGQSLNDDFAPSGPSQFTRNVPSSGGGWTFSWVRKANIFIDRVQGVPMSEEAIEHWTGVGRFFRGLEYHDLVNRFGDVPWFEEELNENDNETLYKERDDRTYVMDKVLEDFTYAAQHVRIDVDNNGQEVNRDVVLGFMSRVFLFEGTWQKYHEGNNEKAREYLEAAKWAADQVISSGRYSLGDYRDTFSSLSLKNNPEVLLFREYEDGVLMHALMSYNNVEPQTGISKDAIDSYLGADGLPIEISTVYQGDHGIREVMESRDPRIYGTVVSDTLRLPSVASNYSTSGFAVHKFKNEEIAGLPSGTGNQNPTDAPIIRYGEVLVNYAEAAAELATLGGGDLTQADLDKSINVLRDRPVDEGVEKLPPLQIIGGQPAVNGVVYDDPERDPEVPAIIWEIRRERRVELMMEGFRLDDLRRWEKLEYVDTVENYEINMGAWIDKSEFDPERFNLDPIRLVDQNGNLLPVDAQEGYIIPAVADELQRRFTDPKVYLWPLPLDQITLYADQGVTLEQNPGWD